MQWPYIAVAKSLEVIPRTLIQNCGGNTIRTLTALRVSPFHSCYIVILEFPIRRLKLLSFTGWLFDLEGMGARDAR